MSDIFKIKRRDTSPAIQWELTGFQGTLLGATVVFNMQNPRGEIIVNRAPAEVLAGAETPTLVYYWDQGDTDVAGAYSAEFEVTFSDGSVETFPNSENIPVRIAPDIG